MIQTIWQGWWRKELYGGKRWNLAIGEMIIQNEKTKHLTRFDRLCGNDINPQDDQIFFRNRESKNHYHGEG